MAIRIPFDSVPRLWWPLAQYLDPPYTTHFNNWEAMAEQLDFKPIEINQIKALKDPTGSNTMIMFNHYTQKTNGGDLQEIIRILEDLNRRDALDRIMSTLNEMKRLEVRPSVPSVVNQRGDEEEPMDGLEPFDRLQHECMRQQQAPVYHQDSTQQHNSPARRQYPPQYSSLLGHPVQQQPVGQPMQLNSKRQYPRQRIHPDPMHQSPQRQPVKDMLQHRRQPLPRQQPQMQQHPMEVGRHADYGVGPVGTCTPPNLPQQPMPMSDRQYPPSTVRGLHIPVSEPQMVYQPTAKQRDSIAQQQESKRAVNVQHHQYFRNTATPQEKPMNLKKPSPSEPQLMPYHNFNKRTEEDFFPGFGQQYIIVRPGESNPSMEVQWQDRHLSSMNPSLGYQRTAECPAEFLDVLIRGENKLDSISQTPLVITPMEASSESRHRIHATAVPQQMKVAEEMLISRSEVQFAGQAAVDMQVRHDISPEPMDHNPSSLPLTISPIKEEQSPEPAPMATPSPAAAAYIQKHHLGREPAEPFQQVPVRESVIQMGPQCNSDSAASPGELQRYTELVQDKDEDSTEERIHSYPEYPMQRPHTKEIRYRCNPARLTWPLSAQDLKQRKAPSGPPTKLVESIIKRHVTSTDKDFKPREQQKQPIKVLLTYTLSAKDSKSHKKELIVLYNCLKKNGFVPSLDFMEPREFSQDTHRWMDTRFNEAQFVLVCITPQYKLDVDYPDPSSPDRQNLYTRSCRYIHRLMQNEFASQHCQNKRFKPVLFLGAQREHVPMWMQSTVAFRWRENWKDIMYMMLEPERILTKMKNNQEKFTKAQPVVKIVQRSM